MSASSLVAIARVVFAVLVVTMIALNMWFLYYVEQLKAKGCKCALGWRRTFIQASLFLFIALAIVGLFVNWKNYFMWLNLAVTVIFIAYVVITREFIIDVKSASCKCAETAAFKTLDVVNILQIALMVVSVVGNLIALFVTADAIKGAAKSKSPRRIR